MPLDLWLIYVATVFVASVIPGPSMLLALTHGLRYGARRAVISAFGNVAATMVQAGASMAGLGVLIMASQNAFVAVKWLGAAYLIWLGWGLWRAPAGALAPPTGSEALANGEGLFAQGFFVALGNPKAVVFFTALFPQFLESTGLEPLRFVVLTATMALIAFGCFMLYAVGGQRAGSFVGRITRGRLGTRILGGAFASAGVSLAAAER